MEDVGIVNEHLVYLGPFGIFCSYLEYFFPFGYVEPRKIWQLCLGSGAG
jgi:hypothetical protein